MIASEGGLNAPYGIKFGSDGDLYVCSFGSKQILKYEGPGSPDGVAPGQFLGVFANTQHTTPFNFDFGPDGNVYVSSNHGVLLGSWSAGGLSSSARLTGIATNDTDIWLVDSYSDKVYEYTGASANNFGY